MAARALMTQSQPEQVVRQKRRDSCEPGSREAVQQQMFCAASRARHNKEHYSILEPGGTASLPQTAQHSGSISQRFRRQQTKEKHSCEHAQDAKEPCDVSGTQEKLKLAFTHSVIWMRWNRSLQGTHAVRRLLLLPSAEVSSSPGHGHVLRFIWQIALRIEFSSPSWITYPIPSSFVMGHSTSGKAQCTEGWEEVGAQVPASGPGALRRQQAKPHGMKALAGRRTGWQRMQGCSWHVLQNVCLFDTFWEIAQQTCICHLAHF